MAASYLSDRSSIAPTDFAICNSFEDETGVISVAVENCQLCGCSRRPFLCPNCVKSGDFCHSHESNKASELSKFQHKQSCNVTVQHERPKQRYREKLFKLQALKKEKSKLLERFKDLVVKRTALQQKDLESSVTKQRVDLLSRAVQEVAQKTNSEKEELRSLQRSNVSTASRLQRLVDKKRRIVEYLDRLQLSIDNRRGELAVCEDQLCPIRAQHVRQLVQHIFPITQVQPRTDSDSVGQSYVSELAEARHTAYIKGRWVYTDNGSEHKYRIVRPTLPGNGDYSSYLNWLLDNKAGSPGPDPLTGDDHPAFTIGAALTYTTQLVSLISYFLDVNLPQRMCYSNFCRNNMSERRFNQLVYKLNYNVLYLCFCQRVDPELLHPRHTIHNVLMLLKTDGIGRCRPFAVDLDMIQSIDLHPEGASACPPEASDSDPEPTLMCDDVDGPTETDWERVPITTPEAEIADSRLGDFYPSSSIAGGTSRLGDTDAQTTSTVGGLMSSAAASVTSLWRATWKS